MKMLEDRIRKDGIVREGNVLKVDSFINHQMDIPLFREMAKEWKRLFAGKTINKVLTYAKDYLDQNDLYEQWSIKRDGASLICRLLFEEATDINFYVGRAINPAHQNPDLPINFNIKMNLVKELSECLKKMGKHIKVSYF